MSRPLRDIDLLVRLKRRRIGQLQERVAAQTKALADCRAAQSDAEAIERSDRDAECVCTEKIEALTTQAGGFRPSELLLRRHVLEGLAQRTKAAATETQRAVENTQSAELALLSLRQEVKRAEHQLELLIERRAKLAHEIEMAQEDNQDEESEEASVARTIGAAYAERYALDCEQISA